MEDTARPDYPSGSRQRSDEEEENRRLVIDMYEAVLKPLDPSRIDDFFAPGYIQHNPMAESGVQGLKDFLGWARGASPEAKHHVKRVLVDGEYVVGHVHVVINPGDIGNAVVDIFRVESGRIAEHWDAAQAMVSESRNDNGYF